MGLLRTLKRAVGTTQTERYQDAAVRLSETYPDTPDGTYRCGKCEEIKSVGTVGGKGIKQTDSSVEGVVFCQSCSGSPQN